MAFHMTVYHWCCHKALCWYRNRSAWMLRLATVCSLFYWRTSSKFDC